MRMRFMGRHCSRVRAQTKEQKESSPTLPCCRAVHCGFAGIDLLVKDNLYPCRVMVSFSGQECSVQIVLESVWKTRAEGRTEMA